MPNKNIGVLRCWFVRLVKDVILQRVEGVVLRQGCLYLFLSVCLSPFLSVGDCLAAGQNQRKLRIRLRMSSQLEMQELPSSAKHQPLQPLTLSRRGM